MNAVDKIMTAFARKTSMTDEETRAIREEVRKFVAELLAKRLPVSSCLPPSAPI
jgi:hypothetical protein